MTNELIIITAATIAVLALFYIGLALFNLKDHKRNYNEAMKRLNVYE